MPGVGAISGTLLNLAFMHRIDVTARRIFQERWLRDSGKTGEIAPAEVAPRQLATGSIAHSDVPAYSGCYFVSFGVTCPIWMVASLFRPMNNAVTRECETARSRPPMRRHGPSQGPAPRFREICRSHNRWPSPLRRRRSIGPDRGSAVQRQTRA